MLNSADELILYDDAQFTRRDWRNRNKIKTSNGPQWLTIPVQVKGKYHQSIKDTVISDASWNRRHWMAIVHSYAKARHFKAFRPFLEELYLTSRERLLSRINLRFIKAMCELLSIGTTLSWSMEYQLTGGRTERLVGLCKQAGATEYLSGPAARSYLDVTLFDQEGITVRWMDYADYPEYHQLFPPFEHGVSFLDLLMNEGAGAPRYMKTLRACENGTMEREDVPHPCSGDTQSGITHSSQVYSGQAGP
jgi:hypothetical protein